VNTISNHGEMADGSSIRVLVVEDYLPFRRYLCSALRRRPSLEIIGETGDGLEAVQKAKELRPDLILLDVGLPTLNGIEVARRVCMFSPESRILFVSQETSVYLVREALSLGAMGYVVKARAANELLEAVESVCRGRLFISSALPSLAFSDITREQDSDRLSREPALPPA
jgi:DNA-binding NarL/FixJ family response regulator